MVEESGKPGVRSEGFNFSTVGPEDQNILVLPLYYVVNKFISDL
jgi:hypothetical protein